MADVEYNGYTIEAQSYRSDGDRSRPKVMLSRFVAGSLWTGPVSAPLDVMFDTEAQANDYAVAMARKWIDERG